MLAITNGQLVYDNVVLTFVSPVCRCSTSRPRKPTLVVPSCKEVVHRKAVGVVFSGARRDIMPFDLLSYLTLA